MLKLVPWLITAAALYYALNGVSWAVISGHLDSAKPPWIFLAALLTFSSYLLRARRWQSLFPEPVLDYTNSARVLILGFFMNNILPARTGEFVRAHMAARISGETRTLVLATIASERLADGLTLSLMFVLFSLGIGDAKLAKELLYVAILFACVGLGVVAVLVMRAKVFTLADRMHERFNSKASHYTANRIQVFINGLAPLCSIKRLPLLAGWSLIIWSVELAVYFAVCQAFSTALPYTYYVLFLVSVNFSSLIPAAPGGIGVIEAVVTQVLVSVGIQKELALTMVVLQHVIQYTIVGIPGCLVMFRWKSYLRQLESEGDGGSEKELVIS